MKKSMGVIAVTISLILPSLASAKDEFSGLLAQVPAPPSTTAAAMLRYQKGHNEGSDQTGFDKAAVKLLAQIDKQEKNLMMNGTKYGGESAVDLKAKMANMSQDEKMAYVMQLSAKMQKDQMSAYTGKDSKAMMQVSQNNTAAIPKSMAVETASKAMSDIDAEFQPQFDALLTDMLAGVKACPQQTVGETSGPAPSCMDPILAKYKVDYQALAEKKMAKYTVLYKDFKKNVSEEIASWQKDIATLGDSSTDAANNEITRKKSMIYEDIKNLTIPADDMVHLGHDAATVDPLRACGGTCAQG